MASPEVRERKAAQARIARAEARGEIPEDELGPYCRPAERPRFCRSCGCGLNSYNRATLCAPCQRGKERACARCS